MVYVLVSSVLDLGWDDEEAAVTVFEPPCGWS
jgi:hypothetical protein